MGIVEMGTKPDQGTSSSVRSTLLWLEDGEAPQRLPQWAAWLVDLGRRAARPADSPRRLIAAVALPSRAFAASLCAVGSVLGADLRLSGAVPSDNELAAHFDRLRGLRPGSTVTVASGQANHVGRFLRVEEIRGEPHLVIAQDGDRKNTFTQLIPRRHSHTVAVQGLGLSCLLVGKLSELEPELFSEEVGTANGEPLSALLKARRFANRRDKDIRSDVIATGADLPAALRDARPSTVVFDGSDAFRRWKERWRHSAWVVVLDRTSRQFGEGVALVEQEFAERRYDNSDPLADLGIPSGVELMSFWGEDR